MQLIHRVTTQSRHHKKRGLKEPLPSFLSHLTLGQTLPAPPSETSTTAQAMGSQGVTGDRSKSLLSLGITELARLPAAFRHICISHLPMYPRELLHSLLLSKVSGPCSEELLAEGVIWGYPMVLRSTLLALGPLSSPLLPRPGLSPSLIQLLEQESRQIIPLG